MPAVILNSVGEKGTNNPSDVMIIQALLNQVSYGIGGPPVKLTVSGLCDTATKYAIGNFQDYWFKWSDGRVDPNGVTLNFLNLKSRPLSDSLPYQPAEPHFVPQRRTNNCWAAVGTMMYGWKNNFWLTAENFVANRCNWQFADWFETNAPLPPGRLDEFVTVTLGMQGKKLAELASSSPAMWLDVLKAFKVVVVQHRVLDGRQTYMHARILCGMIGTGWPESTSVRVIDPWMGANVPPMTPTYNSKLIPYTTFAAEFDAPLPPNVLRVWHY